MKLKELRVLLIDANPADTADLTQKLAESRNATFAARIANDLAQSKELIRTGSFDVVLMDLKVPGSSGISSLKDLDSEFSDIPIVVTSSAFEESEALEAVRAGAQDYVVKGRLNSAALERILLYCIERQRARKRTEMQFAISRVLGMAETREEARDGVLRTLVESLGYDFAQLWLFDHWSGELVADKSWPAARDCCAELTQFNSERQIENGIGIPGCVWANGSPQWITDLQETDIAEASMLSRAGLRSVLAFPITVGPEVRGVIELFSREKCERDDDLIKIAQNIGNMVGQFVARKQAEQERERLTNERLLILECASEGIYGVDLNGCITFMNRAAANMFQCVPAEVSGKSSHQLFHHSRVDGSSYPVKDCAITRVFATSEGCHSDEEYFWRTDGTHFTVDYSCFPVFEDGKIKGAVICFNDITERKRMEVELRHSQKLEAVGSLAAGIAHEINTPIQFVGDNTRFLQEAFRDGLQMVDAYEAVFEQAQSGIVSVESIERVKEVLEKIDWPYLRDEVPKSLDQMLDGINRVASIVRAMKEFSHVDRSAEKTNADLNKALESTLVVARNELKYVADVEENYGGLPPVMCHLGDLNQVFLNLLINAAHAIGDAVKKTNGRGRITIRTRQDGDWVEVAISDTGTGIPKSIADKIFNPFFTTKEVGKGTGQGLALARAIVVEKHGGTLTFETEMGKGTTFYVRLPVNGVPEPHEAVAK